MVGDLGYTGHLIAANALAGVAPDKAASIIDNGCGTGLVGEELTAQGYLWQGGLGRFNEVHGDRDQGVQLHERGRSARPFDCCV